MMPRGRPKGFKPVKRDKPASNKDIGFTDVPTCSERYESLMTDNSEFEKLVEVKTKPIETKTKPKDMLEILKALYLKKYEKANLEIEILDLQEQYTKRLSRKGDS